MQQAHPLDAWLSKAPVTRTAFAESVGCSPSHLSLVAQGKRGVSLELAINIERETGHAVTAEQLLAFKLPAESPSNTEAAE